MTLLRNIRLNLESALQQRQWVRRAIEPIRDATDPGPRALVRALLAAADDTFTPEERSRFGEIERRRRSLLRSFGRLESAMDHGAGSGRGITGAGAHAQQPLIARAALSSKSPFWARLLYALVRESRPAACLELGTNLGISAAYQALALEMNGTGTLVTLEGSEPRARLARRTLEALGLGRVEVVVGRFDETLPGVLGRTGRVSFAFVDGHHEEEATQRYFTQLEPHLDGGALVVFDDIAWSAGMRRAWLRLRAVPRIGAVADLRVLGVCAIA
jgi:predicted O-methyltransferase YrrM